MKNTIDYKAFQAMLNEDFPDTPFTEEEAKAALRNMGELVWTLLKINERVGIIPMDEMLKETLPETPHNP